MGERRTVDLSAPRVIEMELDESLEDTRCVACLMEGKNRSARDCPHGEAVRMKAMHETKRQSVAKEVGRAPLHVLIDMLRKLIPRRPWWASAEGRKRMREQLEKERQEKEGRQEDFALGEFDGDD